MKKNSIPSIFLFSQFLQRNGLALDTRRAGEDSIAIQRDGATPYQKLNYSAVFSNSFSFITMHLVAFIIFVAFGSSAYGAQADKKPSPQNISSALKGTEQPAPNALSSQRAPSGTETISENNSENNSEDSDANAINARITELEKTLATLAKKLDKAFDTQATQTVLDSMPVSAKNIDSAIKQLEKNKAQVAERLDEARAQRTKLEKYIDEVNKQLAELGADNEQLKQVKVTHLSVQQLLSNPINQANISASNRDKVDSFAKNIKILEEKLAAKRQVIIKEQAVLDGEYQLLNRWQSAVLAALIAQESDASPNTNTHVSNEVDKLRDEITQLQIRLQKNKGNVDLSKIEATQQAIYEKKTLLWLFGIDDSLIETISKPVLNVDVKGLTLNALEEQYEILLDVQNQLNILGKSLDERYAEFKKYIEVTGEQPALEKAFSQRQKALAYQKLLLRKQPLLFSEEINYRKRNELFSLDNLYAKNQFQLAFSNISASLVQMGYQVQISFSTLLERVKAKLPILMIAFLVTLFGVNVVRVLNYSLQRSLPKNNKASMTVTTIRGLIHALKKHRYIFIILLFLIGLVNASDVPYPSNHIIRTLIYTTVVMIIWLTVLRVESRLKILFRQHAHYSYIIAISLTSLVMLYAIARMSAVETAVLSLYEKSLMLMMIIFVWFERKKVLHYFTATKQEINKAYRFYLKMLVVLPWLIIATCMISLVGFSRLAWLILNYIGVGILYLVVLIMGLKVINHLRKKAKLYALKRFEHGAFIATDMVSPLFFISKIVWVWLVTEILFWVMHWDKTSYLVVEFLLLVQKPLVTFGDTEINLQLLGLSVLALYIIFKTARWLKTFTYHWLYARIQDLGVRGSLSIFTQYVATLIGVLIALNSLGIDLTSLTVFAGALGVGVGLGLQDIAKNFISGILLLIERPLRNGDWVSIGAHEGTVTGIGMRAITMETFDKQEVIIPNANAISDSFVNNTYSDPILRTVLYIGAGYDTDPNRVIEILTDIMTTNKNVLQEPGAKAILWEYGDSSINYRIQYYVNIDNSSLFETRNQILGDIWHQFKENQIEIPYPQRDINFRTPLATQ